MAKDKRSFFERLSGSTRISREDEDIDFEGARKQTPDKKIKAKAGGDAEGWMEETVEEGQLTVDVYQTPTDIIIKTIVAGLKPEDLDISISRDMVTIRGKREEVREASDDDYFHRELYWGTFSRTILLPEEIDVEASEATEKHGLLIVKLPKVDKRRQTKLRVKTTS
jgi:HSP20 family protein